jgi:hypothetical protein
MGEKVWEKERVMPQGRELWNRKEEPPDHEKPYIPDQLCATCNTPRRCMRLINKGPKEKNLDSNVRS